MKIHPQTYHILVRMKDIPRDDDLILPQGSEDLPHGEVIAVGPDCKFVTIGDKVCFLPENYVAGFNKGGDEQFIIPEGAVFAKLEF